MSGMIMRLGAWVAAVVLAVFSVLGGVVDPPGDRWCVHAEADQVPVVETVDEEVCVPAI